MSEIMQHPPGLKQPEWSAYLERRIMRLLLLHDRGTFRKQFKFLRTESDFKEHPLLQQYDHFLRIIALGDELLDDILPRVRRQLSLHTDHERRREQAPTHGDIDWRRTIDRSLHEIPDQPPLEFDTRLRQRSTVTPENIMVVALMQRFQKALRATQQTDFLDQALASSEVQALTSLAERLERELAAPYAQLLFEQAQQADLELQIEHVEARLPPGVNPYRDLIEWWQRFTLLTFGRAEQQAQDAYVRSRNDEKSVAWLYEFWIALEWLHFLSTHPDADIKPTQQQSDPDSILQWSFTWQAQRWRFRYNRQVENDRWHNAPTTRPDYVIEREAPREVRYGEQLIWREAGVLLDAKYYLTGHQEQPIKKMVGEMTLLDAAQAVLLFPQLPQNSRTITYNQARYPGRNAEIQLQLYQLTPDGHVEELQKRLSVILDYATHHFARPEPIACHGLLVDRDSRNASGSKRLFDRVLCPKPHIHPDRVDLVRKDQDCLRNPQMCHVIGQHILPPYIQRVWTPEELATASQELRSYVQDIDPDDESFEADVKRGALFKHISELAQSYMELVKPDTRYVNKVLGDIFGAYWATAPDCLHENVRNMLIAGEYVSTQLADSAINDWAVSAVQFVRALEYEMTRRLFHMCRGKLVSRGQVMQEKHFTFGTPGYIVQNYTTKAQHNWAVWEYSILEPFKVDKKQFMSLLTEINTLTQARNKIAHKDVVTQALAEDVRTKILGKRNQDGLLLQLIEMLKAPPDA